MAQQRTHRQLACTLALAGALAAIGCQPEAPPTALRTAVAPTPSAEGTLAPIAASTPVGVVATLRPASAAPTALPTSTPSAQPSASVDSDLAQDDEAAVESLLDSDELKGYLPNDLIHDGGVILYQTLGLGAAARQKLGCAGPADPPEIWKRQGEGGDGRQLHVRKVAGQPGVAIAEIKYPDHGTFVYKDGGTAVRKKFVETFRRQIQLERTGKQWRPTALSPITVESQGGKSGLDLQAVNVFRPGTASAALSFAADDRMVSLKDPLPAFQAGSSVRVEVEVTDKQACDLFVFAYLVGGNDRTRQRLFDDGTNGDRTAGDGLYTGTFVIPATPGARHLAVDVLEPTVFTPGGVYRSNVVGMTFQVEK
ncbi:MAG: hypothetical protein JWM80_4367 [Cyanobacteria bacterium RYN_339]|nr:hypothetical protein [Cyanobacteria bacterium RYN_339]